MNAKLPSYYTQVTPIYYKTIHWKKFKPVPETTDLFMIQNDKIISLPPTQPFVSKDKLFHSHLK